MLHESLLKEREGAGGTEQKGKGERKKKGRERERKGGEKTKGEQVWAKSTES